MDGGFKKRTVSSRTRSYLRDVSPSRLQTRTGLKLLVSGFTVACVLFADIIQPTKFREWLKLWVHVFARVFPNEMRCRRNLLLHRLNPLDPTLRRFPS